MRSVPAELMMVDGVRLKVNVPRPPPRTFTLAQFPGPNRQFVLHKNSDDEVTYVELERRRLALPVLVDRRVRAGLR
jgi:hypothetical protein